MKKLTIIVLSLTIYSCIVPVSIGNKSIADVENKNINHPNKYSNDKTMIAINHILPHKADTFEALNKNIILPSIKNYDLKMYNGLKFLVPEQVNDDGTQTFMFIANPYYEEKNYDIFEILVKKYGSVRAEDYFEKWINCFAYEQEVILFK